MSSRGASARLVILMYHRVLKNPDPLLHDVIDAAEFEKHAATLARNFNVLHLSDAAVRLQEGTLPPRAAVITFDDGYRDNFEVALPLLEKYSIPATFFVAAGFLDGGMMWNDRIIETVRRSKGSKIDLSNVGLGVHSIVSNDDRINTIMSLINQLKYQPLSLRLELVSRISPEVGQQLPDDLMMSSSQVLGLSEHGMEIGGHTLNHPILSRLDSIQAETEILAGRKKLEEIIGKRVGVFAYPNGRPGTDYQREHVDMLKKIGFDCGVSTSWGCATSLSDIMQLPRIAPWDRSTLGYLARVMLAYRQNQAVYL